MASKRSRGAFEADLQAQQSPYVFYGTPLPPLDANIRDDGSYVPIWKQEVTDERGRKRLHGAFTGGFSAGYPYMLKLVLPANCFKILQHRWLQGGMDTFNVRLV